jgi:hypothetical protein
MMDKETIKRIAKAQGYTVSMHRYTAHSYRANGEERRSLYAHGNGATRSLGRFEVVTQMSEEQLRERIEATFARPARGGR